MADRLFKLNENTPPGILTLEGKELGGVVLVTAVGAKSVAVVVDYTSIYGAGPLELLPLSKKTRCLGRHTSLSSVEFCHEVSTKAPGVVRTVRGGGIELACYNSDHSLLWVPVPGCSSNRIEGLMFSRWMFVTKGEKGETDYAVAYCEDGEMGRCWMPLKRNWSSLLP